MASTEYLYGSGQRSNHNILSLEVRAFRDRETFGFAFRSRLLVLKFGLSRQWACQLYQDRHQICKEASTGTEWMEDSNGRT